MASLIEDALDGIEALVARARESLAAKSTTTTQYLPSSGTSTSAGVTFTTPADAVASEPQVSAADPEPSPDAPEPAPAPAQEEAAPPAEGPASDPSGPAAGDVPEPPAEIATS